MIAPELAEEAAAALRDYCPHIRIGQLAGAKAAAAGVVALICKRQAEAGAGAATSYLQRAEIARAVIEECFSQWLNLDLSEGIDRWCKGNPRRLVEMWIDPDGARICRIVEPGTDSATAEGETWAEALGAAFAAWDAREE